MTGTFSLRKCRRSAVSVKTGGDTDVFPEIVHAKSDIRSPTDDVALVYLDTETFSHFHLTTETVWDDVDIVHFRSFFLDVTGDGFVTPLDALLVDETLSTRRGHPVLSTHWPFGRPQVPSHPRASHRRAGRVGRDLTFNISPQTPVLHNRFGDGHTPS